MQPLTRELLLQRIEALMIRAFAVGGPVEDVIFEVVRCDGCEATINMLAHGYPVGWRTSGDDEHGWRDLCPDCFARECVKETGFLCPEI